jgi:hypothetical protein
MNVEFLLVASAGPTMPVIRHAVQAGSEETAKFECQQYLVAALSKAGYYRFTLFDTRRLNANGADIQLATFRVVSQEPQILMD